MIKIVKIGKIKRKSLEDETNFFIDRIKKSSKIEIMSVLESKFKQKDRIIIEESENLLKRLTYRDYTICLDIKGNMLSSIKFADKIEEIISLRKNPAFIIGGAYGHSDKLIRNSNFILSLSNFTLQHDIALLVLLEQIYRSFTIIKGHPYHK